MSEAMEVDPPAPPKAGESAPPAATPQQDSEEEDVSDLVELLESADDLLDVARLRRVRADAVGVHLLEQIHLREERRGLRGGLVQAKNRRSKRLPDGVRR